MRRSWYWSSFCFVLGMTRIVSAERVVVRVRVDVVSQGDEESHPLVDDQGAQLVAERPGRRDHVEQEDDVVPLERSVDRRLRVQDGGRHPAAGARRRKRGLDEKRLVPGAQR